ncbi:MAG: hypothetical protein WCR52_06570 [Bacteroidota bacterium]
MKFGLLLPLLLVFQVQLCAQQAQWLAITPAQLPNIAQPRNGVCNFAGTFSLGQFIGQSNDISLDTIFLCAGDSIYIHHNSDYILSGDPVPSTPPWIGWAFYDCPPTVSGPDLNTILSDNCLLPGAQNGIWLYTTDLLPAGSAWFNNSGILQNIFNSGFPIGIWFAPITLDYYIAGNPSVQGYESSSVGAPPGPCVNVNTDAAFEVVYLNPIKQTGVNTNFTNPCLGKFRLEGGLPEWDASALFKVDIALDTNALVKATTLTAAPQMFNGSDIIFSVNKPGKYRVQVDDGKSCGLEFLMDMSGCVPDGQLSMSVPTIIGATGQKRCMPITVENFDVISGAFSVSWNPNELEYVSIEQVNSALAFNFGANNLNLSNLSAGRLGITFYNTSQPGAPIHLNDGQSLLSVCLKPLTEPNPCSKVNITNAPTGITFEGAQGGLIPVHFNPGAICNATPTSEPGALAASLRLFPNTIRVGEPCYLDFGTNEPLASTVSIWDVTGRCLRTQAFEVGKRLLETQHLKPGLYWVSVEAQGTRVMRSLVVVE